MLMGNSEKVLNAHLRKQMILKVALLVKLVNPSHYCFALIWIDVKAMIWYRRSSELSHRGLQSLKNNFICSSRFKIHDTFLIISSSREKSSIIKLMAKSGQKILFVKINTSTHFLCRLFPCKVLLYPQVEEHRVGSLCHLH